MSWPLPQPDDLAERYAQGYEAPDAFPTSDPREPNSFMAVTGRTHAEVVFDLYLYQRSLADELMIDTAQDWLPRHANTYGVPRLPPQKAIGPVIFLGPPNFTLPADIEFVADDGTQWIALAGGETDNTGNAILQVIAEVAGIAGNRVAGTVLTIISTVLGLQLQTVTVGTGGLAGGDDIEDFELWRARILARKRKQGQAGNAADYLGWASAAGAVAAYTQFIPKWAGPTVHAVFIAMPNPAGGAPLIPTAAQVAAVQASIDAVRPATDQPVVIACTQPVQALTMALAKDTVANRALATNTFGAFILTLPIGGLLDVSLLEDAIIQATNSGVQITVPAGDVQAAAGQWLSPGVPNFVAYTSP